MSKTYGRLMSIKQSLEDVTFILNQSDLKITHSIEDKIIKPALRMHIIKIAEQFAKLKEENAFKILEMFDEKDLRGISAVRNFIAHDYDSVDDSIIEDVLRLNFPKLKIDVEKILKSVNSQ